MKSFINCWNLFSKAWIISTNFENNSIIFSIWESINKLKDILWFLKTDFVKLECFSQLVDFIYNENWNYIVNYKLLQTKNINLYQIEQKKSFVLNVWEHFFIEDICKKLNVAEIEQNDINILTKSKQNYKSEWERASFKATYERYIEWKNVLIVIVK